MLVYCHFILWELLTSALVYLLHVGFLGLPIACGFLILTVCLSNDYLHVLGANLNTCPSCYGLELLDQVR
jgi:hypothetical protein